MAVVSAPKQLAQQHREQMLRELVDLWTAETGRTVDEVVAVVADPAQH
ncbi:MAG: hypothetical protein AAGI88_15815 [Pseudomonadota bacterium]